MSAHVDQHEDKDVELRKDLVVQTVHRQESIHLFLVPFRVQIAGHGSEDDGQR